MASRGSIASNRSTASDGSSATGDSGRVAAMSGRRRGLLLRGNRTSHIGDGRSGDRRRLTANKRPDDLGKRLALRPAGGLVVVEDRERALAASDVGRAPRRAADNVLLVRDLGRAVAERDVGDAYEGQEVACQHENDPERSKATHRDG